MQTPTQTIAPGTFCWTDLATTDTAAALDFYAALFGWTRQDAPSSPGHTGYYFFTLNGQPVAAFYDKVEKAPAAPPHWVSYVQVEQVDAMTEKAVSLGAKVLAGPLDADKAGRMSVLMDPTGAVFSLWQAREQRGRSSDLGPGTMCWNELMTRDLEKSTAFYRGLFGWTARSMELPHMTYTIFTNPLSGKDVGGMLKITDEMNMGSAPDNWLVYFETRSVDDVAHRAREAGGRLCVEPRDIPGKGRFAVIMDPQGATFALWTEHATAQACQDSGH